MKNIINSMIIAFSMYSKIPMPHTEWKEGNLKYSFAFFPFVGLIIGIIFFIFFNFAKAYQFNAVFFATICILLNVIITGGIHIDGFCDVMDALSSHKDKEEKLRIMKDPNVGAFAVIYTAVLFLVQLGAFVQLFYSDTYIYAVVLMFAISRMFSGLSILTFPSAKKNGLAATFANGAQKRPVIIILILMLIISFSAIIIIYNYFGLVILLSSIIILTWFYFFSKRQFGGITGDLAGYFLNVFETILLFISAILGVLS